MDFMSVETPFPLLIGYDGKAMDKEQRAGFIFPSKIIFDSFDSINVQYWHVP
jgi:hypothetical protein